MLEWEQQTSLSNLLSCWPHSCAMLQDRAPPPQGYHNNITGSANYGAMQVQTQQGTQQGNFFGDQLGSGHYNMQNGQGNFQAHYNQTSAYIASPETIADPYWYADSDASSYVTSDLGQSYQENIAPRCA
ncbi:hypothetical protein ACOSP7_021208 [Xanthoceras sorbifolium]